MPSYDLQRMLMLVLYSELSAVVCYATEPEAWNAGKFLPLDNGFVSFVTHAFCST